jgi:hypothetical protein
MIAAQMLACHNASMYCYAIALNSNTTGLRHEHLNQAGKLSRTFAMLLDALNRHRGKGQQKITVEHGDFGGLFLVRSKCPIVQNCFTWKHFCPVRAYVPSACSACDCAKKL